MLMTLTVWQICLLCGLGLRNLCIGVLIMANIQNPQRQCWLLVLLMFSRLLNCLQVLGLGLFLVDNFWVDLSVTIVRQLRLFPLRYRCGPAVFVSWLMWLFLSLKLLVLLWLDLYSCNGPISE